MNFFSLFDSPLTLIVASNSSPLVTSPIDSNVPICMDISNESMAFDSLGFFRRCVESNFGELQSRRFENAIMGSSHTFPNASDFQDVLHMMSLVGRFRYSFKRNSSKHMIVLCTVAE